MTRPRNDISPRDEDFDNPYESPHLDHDGDEQREQQATNEAEGLIARFEENETRKDL